MCAVCSVRTGRVGGPVCWQRESWPEHRPFRECGLARSRQTTDAVFARSASGRHLLGGGSLPREAARCDRDVATSVEDRQVERTEFTVSGLAELAGVRKQTMAQAVDQLERTGYVERRPNPRDGRSQLVLLTERGAAVPLVTHGVAARVEERWAELTSRDELEALRASLIRLLTKLRAE
jgi:DNA-binding MarR family transcriptional regulator